MRKPVRIFFLWTLSASSATHSFPRAALLENCWLLGTDGVCTQMSEDIFKANGGYFSYTSLWTFERVNSFLRTAANLKPVCEFLKVIQKSYLGLKSTKILYLLRGQKKWKLPFKVSTRNKIKCDRCVKS